MRPVLFQNWQLLVKTKSQLASLSQCIQSHNKQPLGSHKNISMSQIRGQSDLPAAKSKGTETELWAPEGSSHPPLLGANLQSEESWISVFFNLHYIISLHIHSVEVKTWPRIAEPLSSHPQGLGTPFGRINSTINVETLFYGKSSNCVIRDGKSVRNSTDANYRPKR